MRRLLLGTSLLTACFEEAPPPDGDEGIVASMDDDSSSGEGDESSSSGGIEVEPYGPCETNEDCPIVPGDRGDVSGEARCFEGTCGYECSLGGDAVCPGYFEYGRPDVLLWPYHCSTTTGWCAVYLDPDTLANCPVGMELGCTTTTGATPAHCAWEPNC